MVLFVVSFAWCQASDMKIIHPVPGYRPDFSPEGIKKYEAGRALWNQFHEGKKEYEEFTPEEQELLEYVDEFRGLWDVMEGGCSWYCGGGPNQITASSCLSETDNFTYDAENAHDFDFRTAWIEGAKEYGIGEYLEYHFPPLSPRVNKIKIYNGYVKNETTWKNNSRVKELKLYINDKPYALLKLKDTWTEQIFAIEPMRSNIEGQDLILKFEITDVYKGDKYVDTAITEIYFDGLDVHCFVKGTMITLSDTSEKPIEDIMPGDNILSYNTFTRTIESSIIIELTRKIHSHLIKITFDDLTITSTNDHPYFTAEKGWCSFNPEKSDLYKNIENTGRLAVGDHVLFLKEKGRVCRKKIINIENMHKPTETFAITRLDRNTGYFANGLLVAVEELETQIIAHEE